MKPHPEEEQILRLEGAYRLIGLKEHAVSELDLGCGTGSFSVRLARLYPERQILAADQMIGRLRKLAKRCTRENVGNVSLLRAEAGLLVSRFLPDGGLRRLHLLCPDPWPKGRHRDHRLMCSDFIAQLHRVLEPEGIFHFSSDNTAYREIVAELLATSGLFTPAPEGIADLAGISSDFEERWRAMGLEVPHLAWKRLPLPPKTIGH